VLPPPVKNASITQIFKDQNGRLWAYCEAAGLFVLNQNVWKQYERQSELPKSNPIAPALVDSLNRKWFGYAGNVLAVIDGNRIQTFSAADGLQAGDIKAIYERSGRIWVAGTLGATVFEKNGFHALPSGDPEGFGEISGIIEADDDSLWLNASRGVIHIPVNEVRLFLENPITRFIFTFSISSTDCRVSANKTGRFPRLSKGRTDAFGFRRPAVLPGSIRNKRRKMSRLRRCRSARCPPTRRYTRRSHLSICR